MERVMKLYRKISLGLLLVAVSAATAGAALSGDSNGGSMGIELSGDDSPGQNHFDQLLAVGSISESVSRRHDQSAQRAPAPMGGHYGREGAEAPQLYGSLELPRFTSRISTPDSLADSAVIAQASAVHMVGSGAVMESSAPAVATADTSSSSQVIAITPNDGTGTSVPLPPSFLLLLSGLIGLPLIRQRINQAC
jgi:hypothetical protein